jgi:hypothetical protein
MTDASYLFWNIHNKISLFLILYFSILSFFYNLCGGTLGTAATTGLLYQPQTIGEGDCGENWWNEDWQGKPKYSEKACPSATLSTTNPTSLDPGLNPGRRGGKPPTNRLSYGASILLH